MGFDGFDADLQPMTDLLVLKPAQINSTISCSRPVSVSGRLVREGGTRSTRDLRDREFPVVFDIDRICTVTHLIGFISTRRKKTLIDTPTVAWL